MDQRFHRTGLRRYVVIVDQGGDVVAREDEADASFSRFTAAQLPDEIRRLVSKAPRAGATHMLSPTILMHVVPFKGTGGRLRALVFEEMRVRAEP